VGVAGGPRPTTNDQPEDYCRQVEAYLCRKNDGHLIRIVGPSFETVCAWAERGVPLSIAFRGIDRHFERYYAKGPRRRPVRIDFCEADVLDAFDEWRRAVGISLAEADAVAGDDAVVGADMHVGPSRKTSLSAHLDRVVNRLTARRAGPDRLLDPVIDRIIRELDAARASAKNLRGAARAELLDRLAALDAELLAAAKAAIPDDLREELQRESERELATFRARMPSDAYGRSLAACVDRLIRDRARLPVLTLE
jgi:hypothetical protein